MANLSEITIKSLIELEKTGVTILRREYGKEKIWKECSITEAFEDFLHSDRWGCDDYVKEEDSLEGFVVKFNGMSCWIKTEKFFYRFINFSLLDQNQDEKNTSEIICENPEDDFISSLT